jgi:hypothetical protein
MRNHHAHPLFVLPVNIPNFGVPKQGLGIAHRLRSDGGGSRAANLGILEEIHIESNLRRSTKVK